MTHVIMRELPARALIIQKLSRVTFFLIIYTFTFTWRTNLLMHSCSRCLLVLVTVLSVDNYFSGLCAKKVSTLKFQDSVRALTALQHLSEIVELYNSSTVLCVVSKNEEVTGIFLSLLQRNGLSLNLKYLSNEMTFCNSVVALEMNITNCYAINSLYKSSFYFLNIFSTTNFSQLEECLVNSSSPEVVVLSSGSVYQLSNVFPVPRSFKESSVAEVLRHRRKKELLELGSTKVVVACMHYPPFLIFPDTNKPEMGDGIEYMLVQALSRHLNFTVQWDVYPYWGKLRSNGTWHGEGLAQAMQERRADMAVANIWQIPSFNRILDFGPTLNKNSLGFLVRRPEQIEFQWQVFVMTYSPLVWMATLLAFVVVVIVHHVGLVWELQSQDRSWARSLVTVFGYFTMTSLTHIASASSRPLLTSWSMFSLLFMSSLSTGIVSRLTLPFYSPRVDTPQQMVEAFYNWTTQNYKRFQSMEIRSMLFDFDDEWSRQLETRYIFMEKNQVKAEIKTNWKLAFVVQTYGDDYLIIDTKGHDDQSELEGFRRTKYARQGCHLSWGVKKHSPLLQPLTSMTQRFIQAGLPKQWRKQVVRRFPKYDVGHLLIEQDTPTFGEPKSLTLAKIKPMLYILALGLAIASLIFLIEIAQARGYI